MDEIMTREKLAAIADRTEAEHAKEFEEISHFVFTHPELGLREKESSAHIIEYIKSQGFEVETPVCGLDTAFIASFGEGPVIDFLAEYDALPGYGPEKKNAHACGHNWIAASMTASAVTLAGLVRKGLIKAKIRLVGTPAEETMGGKIPMAEAGIFDGTMIAFSTHLSRKTCCAGGSLAMNCFEFTYTGKASHAAGAPWEGINALDSVNLLFAGINALRQHVKPDVRMHGIVTEGGTAPNIVPAKAAAKFYVRAASRAYLNEIIPKVMNVAKGAALMTGAELSVTEPEAAFDDFIPLEVLDDLAEKNLRELGIEFEERKQGDKSTGSTDVGNVSHRCPTLYFDMAPKTPVFCHEESALAVVDSPEAYETIHQSARVIARCAIELLGDAELADKVRAEFSEKVK